MEQTFVVDMFRFRSRSKREQQELVSWLACRRKSLDTQMSGQWTSSWIVGYDFLNFAAAEQACALPLIVVVFNSFYT